MGKARWSVDTCGMSVLALTILNRPENAFRGVYSVHQSRASYGVSLAFAESPQSDEVEGVFLWRTEVLLQRTFSYYLRKVGVSLFPTYSQTETKESKWDMPDELLLLLEKVEKEGKAAPQPASALVYAYIPSCYPSVAH